MLFLASLKWSWRPKPSAALKPSPQAHAVQQFCWSAVKPSDRPEGQSYYCYFTERFLGSEENHITNVHLRQHMGMKGWAQGKHARWSLEVSFHYQEPKWDASIRGRSLPPRSGEVTICYVVWVIPMHVPGRIRGYDLAIPGQKYLRYIKWSSVKNCLNINS